MCPPPTSANSELIPHKSQCLQSGRLSNPHTGQRQDVPAASTKLPRKTSCAFHRSERPGDGMSTEVASRRGVRRSTSCNRSNKEICGLDCFDTTRWGGYSCHAWPLSYLRPQNLASLRMMPRRSTSGFHRPSGGAHTKQHRQEKGKRTLFPPPSAGKKTPADRKAPQGSRDKKVAPFVLNEYG